MKKIINTKEPKIIFSPDVILWGKYFSRRNRLRKDFEKTKLAVNEFNEYLNTLLKQFKITLLDKDNKKLAKPEKILNSEKIKIHHFRNLEKQFINAQYFMVLVYMSLLQKDEKLIEADAAVLTSKIIDLRVLIRDTPAKKVRIKKDFHSMEKLLIAQTFANKYYKTELNRHKGEIKDILERFNQL